MVPLKSRFLTTYIAAIASLVLLTVCISGLVLAVIMLKDPVFAEKLGPFLGYVFGSGRFSLLPYFLVWFAQILTVFLIIGAVLLWRYDRKVVSPVNEVKIATRQICDGEYDTEIIGSDRQEIHELCLSLDDMRIRLKEKSDAEAAVLADRNLLIANISHDMRTPVTTIRGYLQAIEDGVAHTPEQIQTCYDHIRAKTEFLEFLAADMAEYSDQESGRMRYCFESVELCAFLKDMATEYSDETESKGFVFSCVVPETPVYIRADRYRLQRVMQNLLSNAIKYNKPGGTIDVTLEVDAPYIYLCVSDSGIGVGSDSLKKVFDSFYREDSSRGNISGHGLGLAIARQIVEAHKGKIWMQSKENEGTQVFLCFPIIDREGTEQ